MTWTEIKEAVEASGIKDDEDICTIQCAIRPGNKTLRPIRLGKFVRLTEDPSASAAKARSGQAA